MAKAAYKISNWGEYNKSLVNRGSLTLWFEEDALEKWLADQSPKKQRGRPRTYSDGAIQCMLVLKAVYRLPLRATQGFAQSIMKLLGLDLSTPDYTTVCKRQKQLDVPLIQAKKGESLHAVFDSTGLKIFGEGEWKVRQHGYTKRRTWRKLHLGINEATHEIIAAALSTNDFKDNQLFPDLLDQIDDPIHQASGDGAYDDLKNFQLLDDRGIKATIPTRRGSKIKQHGNTKHTPHNPRDAIVREIRARGRKKWKEENNYHRRSLSETAMFRYKQIFGDHLNARLFESQAQEAFIKCNILNKMTGLGMPKSYLFRQL